MLSHYIFQDIDDEAKLRDIDFKEFDQKFQLPTRDVESRDRGDRIIQRNANLITFVEHSRARNMSKFSYCIYTCMSDVLNY